MAGRNRRCWRHRGASQPKITRWAGRPLSHGPVFPVTNGDQLRYGRASSCRPIAAGPRPPPEQTDPILNRARIAVRNLQSGATTGVFGLSIIGGMPAATSDGSRVVYVALTNGNSDYDFQDPWTVVRGGTPQRIMLAEGAEHSPALSPDGQRMAYIKLDENGDGRLFVANVNGQSERMVTPAINYAAVIRYSSPSWSPDGTCLLFSAGEPGRLHLWTANADDGRRAHLCVRLPQPISGVVAGWPTARLRLEHGRQSRPRAVHHARRRRRAGAS